ncbi:barstar family protein [Thauera aromatica]|uniref:Barstar (barnase inhibitor) domain-containing protein n=1 Tax=Thauera aromatica K172 TaxID=44139 RepID=A0A2R4BMB3_THAAR|nr:barstar family protein [Thauera aromatica]AVR88477.1 hypothetical protein Tharo_1553 [Thauera aromatica K172]
MSASSPTPANSATPTGSGSEIVAVTIALDGCDSKAELLARIAAALHFPGWFGHNWDALADCLTDLSWLPASAYRITLTQAAPLRRAAPETLATALEIFHDAAAAWADQGVDFSVCLTEDGADDGTAPSATPAARQ